MGIAGLIGGGLSAIGSIAGAREGARAQERQTQLALDQQRQSQQQATNILSPYVNAGQQMLPQLQQFIDPNQEGGGLNLLMRMLQPGADQTALLEQTPGYQFNLNQGLRASNNALAARGLGGSGGAAAKGAANYASGLAGNTWQSIVQGLQNAFTSGSGAMQNYANMGANAGNTLAGGIMNMGNSMANNMTGLGNAQAGAYTQMGNALGGFGNNLGQYGMMQNLMGSSALGGSMYGNGGGLNNGMSFNNYNMNSPFYGPLN